MAYIVESDVLMHAVLNELEKTSVILKNSSHIEDVRLPSDNETSRSFVTLKTGEEFSCDLLVSSNTFVHIFIIFYTLDEFSADLILLVTQSNSLDIFSRFFINNSLISTSFTLKSII